MISGFCIYEDYSKNISTFHTDCGNEFKNNNIKGILETFDIETSLSCKGCPYDNAVVKATFKTLKNEFAYPKYFESLEQLKLELFEHLNWYNLICLHYSLG